MNEIDRLSDELADLLVKQKAITDGIIRVDSGAIYGEPERKTWIVYQRALGSLTKRICKIEDEIYDLYIKQS